jgi:hypothetical protein
MEIYTSIDQIKRLNIFNHLDHPVALTAPLIVDDEVIIGMYCQPDSGSRLLTKRAPMYN